eukprot:1152402-Pelagomonas_calceolata.AAC.13
MDAALRGELTLLEQHPHSTNACQNTNEGLAHLHTNGLTHFIEAEVLFTPPECDREMWQRHFVHRRLH